MHFVLRVYAYEIFISRPTSICSPLKYFCLHKWAPHYENNQKKTQSHCYRLEQRQIKKMSHILHIYENAGRV